MSKLTEDQVTSLRDEYIAMVNAGADYDARQAFIEVTAKEMKVTVPTIRGKLVSEKVYVGKQKVDKSETGDSESKMDIVAALAAVSGKDMPSLAKASKKDLETLWNWIVLQSDRKAADKAV